MTGDISMPVIVSLFLLGIGMLVFVLFTFMDRQLDQQDADAGVAADEEFKFADIIEIGRNRAFWYITILCFGIAGILPASFFYSPPFIFLTFRDSPKLRLWVFS